MRRRDGETVTQPTRNLQPATCNPPPTRKALIMAIAHRISEQEYRELALTEEGRLLELWDGVPREKPLMSMKHDDVAAYLGAALISQLDRRKFRVNVSGGKTRYTERNYFIPDVVVIPAAYKIPFEDDPRAFNAFAEPLPLVVEVWSRTTGHYDFTVKLRGYRERGDEEMASASTSTRCWTDRRETGDGGRRLEDGRTALHPTPIRLVLLHPLKPQSG
jgi:Uma2 family endonuclease